MARGPNPSRYNEQMRSLRLRLVKSLAYDQTTCQCKASLGFNLPPHPFCETV